ncbi:maleylpyruvate isomerase N-terminal domain-containing protein [Arthrobacter sp. I2-34]|uniref:Maleylpyruvate isomerase N-terminal domain-containing protein n=1 Tax=Arthrobacter hankyongi TaxID=2904801 RepID=A0ABS9L4Y4_9MICC|nr:maleylpyruvate isomerase N-terminal domain-containing protein [Arthrobacter hankyongi]MCG2621714.1 maleylpyruvate isomerase N-terminal domain-containing protein [Arthrobacter hankyongi]
MDSPLPQAATYLAAAASFRELLARVPPDAWDRPGLGHWTVRTLAGHTSRALVTVLTYLDQPAERVERESAAAYFSGLDFSSSPDITARAVAAGEALGEDPLATVDGLLARLQQRLPRETDRVIHTIAGGMRISDYLPTRIFELAVHSLDLAAACGLAVRLPPDVERAAAELAVQIAVGRGDGAPVLQALTGRAALPQGYSVV